MVKCGYSLTALTADYTDKPPADLKLVRKNRRILEGLLKSPAQKEKEDRGSWEEKGGERHQKGIGRGKKKDKRHLLGHFIQRTTEEVYSEALNGLMEEIKFVLDRNWVGYGSSLRG